MPVGEGAPVTVVEVVHSFNDTILVVDTGDGTKEVTGYDLEEKSDLFIEGDTVTLQE